ncbi:hypothetical protein CUMW_018080 [Citrus unshiu]|nr:hypothetical protein CUMW_018080 [Citrus unshiu]
MEGKAKEEAGKGGVIDTWLRKHRLIYIGATRHPFILAIRDGTVNYSSFKKWLVSSLLLLTNSFVYLFCQKFLESLMSPEVDYTVAITVFWAIEAVYQESFAHCLEPDTNTPPELQEVCQRWGNDGFGQYCHSLKKIANRLLEKASDDLIVGKAGDDVLKKAEVELIRVLEHEVEFWNMSRGTA